MMRGCAGRFGAEHGIGRKLAEELAKRASGTLSPDAWAASFGRISETGYLLSTERNQAATDGMAAHAV